MVKIYTFSDKRPDFISIQNEYFQKFLQDEEYEFIVCNNASSADLSNQILNTCETNNLRCLEVDKNFTDPAIACEVPINSCLNKYIKHDKTSTITVIIDSDIFLFAPISFKTFLGNCDLAGVPQQREKKGVLNLSRKNIIYLWNALLIFKNSKIVFEDFDVSIIPGITDVGGNLFNYLKKHKPMIRWIKHTADIEDEEKVIFKEALRSEYKAEFGMQILADCFIHYYRGSNWDDKDEQYHHNKTMFLKGFLKFSEKEYPLSLAGTDGFNNQYAHVQKHYNGIRNNRNNTFNLSKAF